jgi:hypothetical protein
LGPSVAATASAKMSTPFNIADLPSRPNFSSLALQLLEVFKQAANCGLNTRFVMWVVRKRLGRRYILHRIKKNKNGNFYKNAMV